MILPQLARDQEGAISSRAARIHSDKSNWELGEGPMPDDNAPWLDYKKPASCEAIVRRKWSAYAKPGSYTTKLAPDEESKFQSWVKTNKVPWQDTPTADYDMRGYWKAQVGGDKNARTAINPVDHRLHYPDTWKTPYHQTFSRESQYALPTAGHWEGQKFIPPSTVSAAPASPDDGPWKDFSAKKSTAKPAAAAALAKAATPTEFEQENTPEPYWGFTPRHVRDTITNLVKGTYQFGKDALNPYVPVATGKDSFPRRISTRADGRRV